jgi:DNA topoisomerase-2
LVKKPIGDSTAVPLKTKVEGGDVLQLHAYRRAEDILTEFYALRLPYYEKRRQAMLAKMRSELELLDQTARFILMVLPPEQLKIRNVPRSTIVAELWKHKFPLRSPPSKTPSPEDDADEDASAGDVEAAIKSQRTPSEAVLVAGYSYLMKMPLWSLTRERVDKLKGQQAGLRAKIQALEATTDKQLWLADLDELAAGLDQDDRDRARAAAHDPTAKRAIGNKGATKAPASKAHPGRKGGDIKRPRSAAPPISAPKRARVE